MSRWHLAARGCLAEHGGVSVHETGAKAVHIEAAGQHAGGRAGQAPALPGPPLPVPIHMPSGPSVQIYYRMPVTAPVAFLTIDDGLVQLPSDLTVMHAAHIPFTMFLIGPVAAHNP